MNKKAFDIIFIILTATLLILWLQYGDAENYLVFSLIPLLAAYKLGQYSERTFRK